MQCTPPVRPSVCPSVYLSRACAVYRTCRHTFVCRCVCCLTSGRPGLRRLAPSRSNRLAALACVYVVRENRYRLGCRSDQAGTPVIIMPLYTVYMHCPKRVSILERKNRPPRTAIKNPGFTPLKRKRVMYQYDTIIDDDFVIRRISGYMWMVVKY